MRLQQRASESRPGNVFPQNPEPETSVRAWPLSKVSQGYLSTLHEFIGLVIIIISEHKQGIQ